MKLLYILLISTILSSCAMTDCRLGGKAKYESKETKTQDNTTDKNKETLPNLKDVVDNLRPEAKYSCRF